MSNPYFYYNKGEVDSSYAELPAMRRAGEELIRLEGHPILPNGLYRWSDENRVWIQV